MPSSRAVRAAHEVLKTTGIKEPPVPVFEIARELGVTLRIGPLPKDLSGFLIREKGKIVLGVNSLHPRQRQAFTVAHELGHLRLHPDGSFVDHGFSFYFRDARSSKATDPREIQANQFAAELLMPEQFIDPILHGRSVDLGDEQYLNSLAKRFQVSSQALSFRLSNLGLARQRANS